MSSSVSIATPSRPTSPSERGWSESWPIRVGMSNAVERPGLTVVEQVAEALVRLLGGAEAGELAHRPQAAAVHGRVDAAGERELAGVADVLVVAGNVIWPVQRLDRFPRERRALLLRRVAGTLDYGCAHRMLGPKIVGSPRSLDRMWPNATPAPYGEVRRTNCAAVWNSAVAVQTGARRTGTPFARSVFASSAVCARYAAAAHRGRGRSASVTTGHGRSVTCRILSGWRCFSGAADVPYRNRRLIGYALLHAQRPRRARIGTARPPSGATRWVDRPRHHGARDQRGFARSGARSAPHSGCAPRCQPAPVERRPPLFEALGAQHHRRDAGSDQGAARAARSSRPAAASMSRIPTTRAASPRSRRRRPSSRVFISSRDDRRPSHATGSSRAVVDPETPRGQGRRRAGPGPRRRGRGSTNVTRSAPLRAGGTSPAGVDRVLPEAELGGVAVSAGAPRIEAPAHPRGSAARCVAPSTRPPARPPVTTTSRTRPDSERPPSTGQPAGHSAARRAASQASTAATSSARAGARSAAGRRTPPRIERRTAARSRRGSRVGSSRG